MITLEKIIASDWFKQRPRSVQQAIKKWPPNALFLMNTGQKVSIYSYEENKKGGCDSCKVIVKEGYNKGMMVFNVPFSDFVGTVKL